MKSIKATVNPEVLRWAREAINVSAEEVAISINKKSVAENTILNWENGRDQPNIVDAKRLAKMYGLHLAVFYLPEPPKKIKPIKDFRATTEKLSKSFILLMREIQNKQEWLSEHLQLIGQKKLDFVGSISINDPIDQVIQKVHKYFDFQFNTDYELGNDFRKILKKRIRILEDKGVFIFMGSGVHTKATVSAHEVRGFTIASEIAPVIYVNSKDYESAKLFTLFHELIHIMLGESCISDVSYKNTDEIEVFCNKVTAELMVPKDKFLCAWQDKVGEIENKVSQIAKIFNVSNIVILIRAYRFGLVALEQFNPLKEKFKKESIEYHKNKQEKMKLRGGGPDQLLLKSILNGKRYSQLVLGAYYDKFISISDVPYLLNVKTNKINDYVEVGNIYQ